LGTWVYAICNDASTLKADLSVLADKHTAVASI
jgi:hypothetical protein